MDLNCPGREANANLNAVEISCPSCGRTVEIFGDEVKVHCRCGQWVFRDALPSCAMWCPAAQKCLGDIGNLKEMMQEAGNIADFEEQKARLKELCEKIRQAQESCALPEAKAHNNTPPAPGSEKKE